MTRDLAQELLLNLRGGPCLHVISGINGQLPDPWQACDLNAIAPGAEPRRLVTIFAGAKRMGRPFEIGVGAKIEVTPGTEGSELLRIADALAEQLRARIALLKAVPDGNRVRVKLDSGAQLPERKTAGASGYDLCAKHDYTVGPGSMAAIDTGVVLELPSGTEAQVRPRSGASLHGFLVQFGTVDADFRGSVKVIVHNATVVSFDGKAGDRIAQLVFASVLTPELEVCEELSQTERGECGLGSTGK